MPRLLRSLSLLALLLTRPVDAGEPRTGTLGGVLRERGTRRPLPAVTLFLAETGAEATSDEKGRFLFRRLAPRSYRLVISTIEHKRISTTLLVRAGEHQELALYLERRPVGRTERNRGASSARRDEGAYREYLTEEQRRDAKQIGDFATGGQRVDALTPRTAEGQLEVLVRGRKPRQEVSRSALRGEEAAVVAGAGGDPVKAVESLPGVAQGGLSSVGVPVRGSNPEDTRILLDGHEIPLLFHLDSVRSVYQSALLSEITLLTGGFGPAYGNATGGVVVLETRPPRMDGWHGHLDLSLLDASLLVEGPITNRLGIAIAFRRSTIDLLLPLVVEDSPDFAFTSSPTYYDYQAKLRFAVNSRHTLSLDAYGAIDSLGMLFGKVSDADPLLPGSLDLSLGFHGVFARHRYKGPRLESSFSPGFLSFRQRAAMGPDRAVEGTKHSFVVREDLQLSLGEALRLKLGARIEPWFGRLDADYFRPSKEGDVAWSATNQRPAVAGVDLSELLASAYLVGELRLGRLTLSPGARFEYDLDLDAWALGPRLGLRWQVAPSLALRAALGLYHRLPDDDERAEGFGNQGLGFERAIHVVAGADWELTPSLRAEVQGYYKQMSNLVAYASGENAKAGAIYDNQGRGLAFGGEVLLKASLGRKLFAWASYSLSRSERNDGFGTVLRPHDLDQTHNLVVLGSFEVGRGVRLGLRFQVTSGTPYTAVAAGAFNADTGSYLPLFDQRRKNAHRQPAFHRLDLRIDKRWSFRSWALTAYLDVQNLYAHANPVDTGYNYDFSERAIVTGIPILPSLGIKGEL